MHPKTRVISNLIFAISLLCSSTMRAEDTAALTQRLTSASETTSINSAGIHPWHLKMDVQLYDEKGKPSEQGTVEEWWAAPGREKRTYDFPSYKATEVHNAGKISRTQGTSYPPIMAETLRQQVVHPMPESSDRDAAQPEIRKLNFGKVPLECIMLAQPIKGLKTSPIGLFPPYCLDPGKDSLRISYEFGTQLVVRNQIGRFQQKLVPLDVVVRSGDALAASAHVTTLASEEVADTDLSTDGLQEVGNQTVRLSSSTMAGTILSRPDPIYPAISKQDHVSGTVMLHALIGTDGHIHKLDVVSSPDPNLAIAAIAAVRKWTYKPYVLNGSPTQVDTTITVNFSFSLAR